MDTHKISSLLASLHDALKVVELSIELAQQTTRFRNMLSRNALENVTAGAIRAIVHLEGELVKELTE